MRFSKTNTVTILPQRDEIANHGNNHFDPEHNDRERNKDSVQELYGLNIIRGEDMIDGTNSDTVIVGSSLVDSVIVGDGNDEPLSSNPFLVMSGSSCHQALASCSGGFSRNI